MDNLGDRIHDVLSAQFELTPDHPVEPLEYLDASEGRWERNGDPVEWVIAEIAGLEEKPARDLAASLSDKHGLWALEGGEEDPYGSDAMYSSRQPDDTDFRFTWSKFCVEVKSRSRFFSATSEKMLDFIFGDLTDHMTLDGISVVREIDPGDEDGHLWRARVAASDEELEEILKSPEREMSSPPERSATSGRMNPLGIPVFYGAEDCRTCVSEVRPAVGAHVVLGRFDFTRSVRLVDLDMLSNVHAETSYFDPQRLEVTGRARFFKSLVNEISRPVMPLDEELEYLPTQAVAEYLAHRTSPRIDGVAFRSSQTGGEGRNVVLFNRARGVEPDDSPEGLVQEVFLPNNGFVDPQDDLDEILVFETLRNENHGGGPSIDENLDPPALIRLTELIDPENDVDSILRLDRESIKVFTVRKVEYDSTEHSVTWNRKTAEERNEFSRRVWGTDFDA